MKTKKYSFQVFTLLIMGIFIIGQACEKGSIFNSKHKLIEEAESLNYLTENFPPYNYEQAGIVNGVSADLLFALFKEMGIQLDKSNFIISDWSEAYQNIQEDPGTVLFSMVQNAERINLFKWVGPISPHKEVLISLSGGGVKIVTDADMNKYTIGYIQGYPSYNLLLDRGVDQGNLISYENTSALYSALSHGEVQCISYSEQANSLIIGGLGLDLQDFSIAYIVQIDLLYYAFNKSVSDELIEFFQENLDKLKSNKEDDGSSTLEKILNTYSVILHAEDNITEEMVIELVNLTSANIESDASGTISLINNQEAPYKDSENGALYCFAYNTDLTVVAHATNSSIIGANFKGKPDAAGKLFRDEILAGALANGTGWVDYIYTKPDQGGLFQKTTYYRLSNGSDGTNYIVCAGKYK